MSESTSEADLYGIVPEEFGPETIEGEHPPLDQPGVTASSAEHSSTPGDADLAAEAEVEPAD